MTEKIDRYKKLKSSKGNFRVHDTIGVPHPYMITSKHVTYTSDNFNGMLGSSAIESAENEGITCGICRGKLSYKEHETALVIQCDKDVHNDKSTQNELQKFMLKLKPRMKKDKYVGFVLMRNF